MKRTYTVILSREPEGGYTVVVPALPGCLTEGETIAEALLMAQDVIQLFLEVLQEDGDPIPEDDPHVNIDMTETAEVIVCKVGIGEATAVA